MFLGIEIGGTKLQLGIGPGDGRLAGLWRSIVDVTAGQKGIRKQIESAVPELLMQSGIERGQVKGVGIGFGGPVDDGTRAIIKSHQITGWQNFPLADWITELTGWPAELGNDADVAGLAEASFGAGEGLSPIFYITIGSGIGGGLIINGEIYRGVGRGAAEIGHLRVPVTRRAGAPELSYVPLEEEASGWAIGRKAGVTATEVAAAALKGDVAAQSVLDDVCVYLAEGICQVIALLCPRRIIIGGGVSLMGDELLFQPLRKLVAERVFGPFAHSYDIMPAELGEEVVVHGALALARQRLGR